MVRNISAHQRAFLRDEIALLADVVKPRRVQKEEQKRDRAYESLSTKFKTAAEESGQPISAENAEWLVRCHPAMPSPFAGLGSRATFRLVTHPPDVIQQHFDGASGKLARKTFTVFALDSLEGFENLAARASTNPLCFDALYDAAMLAGSPDRVMFRSIPAEEHLRRWKYAVRQSVSLARPAPRVQSVQEGRPRPLFRGIVKDLMACGLSKLRNEATEGVTSACDVVAQVYGVSPSTVRTAFDRVKKHSA